MNSKNRHIHFVGIGGIGVSALAQVAQARGIEVSGSDPGADPVSNPAIARLIAGGARIERAHAARNLTDSVTEVVYTAAMDPANPELEEARRRGLPLLSRAQMLGEVMAAHAGKCIAVAGTHGKTTTTAMLGAMLVHAGFDPTVFVGGEVPQIGGNVRVGSEGGPLVAEACEAFGSFLSLRPDILLINNIEAEHLDYYKNYAGVQQGFLALCRNVKPGGVIIACADHAGVAELWEKLEAIAPTVGFGIDSERASSVARNVTLRRTTSFDWEYRSQTVSVALQVPGRHNVLNALGAATVAALLDVGREEIAAGLGWFRGAGRRQEILGTVPPPGAEDVLVMDDYAHHPSEIAATLAALREAYPQRRLVAAFQPHLYSRTRDFLPDFIRVLGTVDQLVVTDIYPAREAPIPGVTAESIVEGVNNAHPEAGAIYVPDKQQVPDALRGLLRTGDLALFLGAGDIREAAEQLAAGK